MIIRRETLQAVLPAMQADDKTHRCDKIEVRPDGTIAATDGHILLTARETHRFPDEDFPSKDLPAYHGDPAAAVTIDRPLVERLLKAIPKKSVIPILACAQLGQNGDGTYLAATDLDAPTLIRLKPQSEQAGGFPNWDRIIPRTEAAIAVTLSADVLQQLTKAAIAVTDKSKNATVTLFVPTEPQYQGLDKAKAIAAGCYERSTQYGKELIDPETERPAAERDYPNGELQSAMRVEITGRDVAMTGAVAVCRRGK